jgi:hypothetical protein
MAWQVDSQILEVGPVAETNSDVPTSLKLKFSGSILVEVDATMPSGTEYVFQAAEHLARFVAVSLEIGGSCQTQAACWEWA